MLGWKYFVLKECGSQQIGDHNLGRENCGQEEVGAQQIGLHHCWRQQLQIEELNLWMANGEIVHGKCPPSPYQINAPKKTWGERAFASKNTGERQRLKMGNKMLSFNNTMPIWLPRERLRRIQICQECPWRQQLNIKHGRITIGGDECLWAEHIKLNGEKGKGELQMRG